MGGLKELKKAISMDEFYREFRESVRDPILSTVTGKKGAPIEQFVQLLEDELPQFLYTVITRYEEKNRPGMSKFIGVIHELEAFLATHKLDWLTPWLVPIIQRSVRLIYRRYFEAWFDSHGLEDTLEWLAGFELSSDSVDSPTPEDTPGLVDELEPETE